MPKASKATTTEHIEVPGYEGHTSDLGGITVAWESYTADTDLAPMLVGLPDDRCQSEHWGYVFEGKILFHTAEGDEEFTAGEAYYVRPGHTPVLFAGSSVVEFSPTDKLQQTVEVVMRNMKAAGG